jgi:putative transposase
VIVVVFMPLKPKHFLQNKKFFHITLSYQVSILMKDLDWIFVQKVLAQQSQKFEIEIQALVLMDSHLHLIVANTVPNEHFFTEAVQIVLGGMSADSHVCERIDNLSQYLNTYKYVYRNPVEAGMCELVQNYQYSSLSSILGKSFISLPIYDQLGVIQNPFHVLNWLNFENSYKSSKLSWLVNEI